MLPKMPQNPFPSMCTHIFLKVRHMIMNMLWWWLILCGFICIPEEAKELGYDCYSLRKMRWENLHLFENLFSKDYGLKGKQNPKPDT